MGKRGPLFFGVLDGSKASVYLFYVYKISMHFINVHFCTHISLSIKMLIEGFVFLYEKQTLRRQVRE